MGKPPIVDSIYNAVAENKLAMQKSSKYRAELRYRLRKAERGECSYGSCHVVTRGGLCDVHKAKINAGRKRRMDNGKHA